MILHRIAEQRRIAVEGLCHQQLGLAGFCVDLDQNALGAAAVLFGVEKAAVEHGIKGCLQHLFVILVAQTALHQGERIAHSRIAGAHIQPVAIADGGPCIVLAAVACVVVFILRVGHNSHRASAQIVHDAVRCFDILFGMGELFKVQTVFVVIEGVFLIDVIHREQVFPHVGGLCSVCALSRSRQLHRCGQQHSCRQNTADDPFPFHDIAPLLHSLCRKGMRFLWHSLYEKSVNALSIT